MYLYKYAGHYISVTNPFLEYLIDKDGQKKKKRSPVDIIELWKP